MIAAIGGYAKLWGGQRASRGASGLRKDGYEFAANMANMDADRSQSAALANQQAELQHQDFLAKLGLDKATSDRANIDTIMQTGSSSPIRWEPRSR